MFCNFDNIKENIDVEIKNSIIGYKEIFIKVLIENLSINHTKSYFKVRIVLVDIVLVLNFYKAIRDFDRQKENPDWV